MTINSGDLSPPIPTGAEIHARVVRQIEAGELHVVVPPPVPPEVMLARAIISARPDPLSSNPAAVSAWFGILSLLARHPDGLTAKQLARRLGSEQATPQISSVLETLADRGELRRVTKGAVRFFTKAPVKVLPHLLRQFPVRP